MSKKIEQYNLTEEEFQRCLSMAEIATLMHGVSYSSPKSIFVISQAGGGKTGLKSYVINEKHSKRVGSFIEFNPDEIAVYHKYYKQIIEEYPNDSYAQLQKFVLPALDDYLRQKAVMLKNNIIQEGTFGSTEGYIRILEFQKNGGTAKIGKIQLDNTRQEVDVEGGYDIEINVLAVDRFESLISSYEREQYFIEANLPPRAVTPENHDRAYYRMLDTLRQIQEKNLYDTIRIFRRGKVELEPELIYTFSRGEKTDIANCVEELRNKNREQLISNPQDYFQRINSLRNKRITTNLKKKIDALEQEFIAEIQKQGER